MEFGDEGAYIEQIDTENTKSSGQVPRSCSFECSSSGDWCEIDSVE
jgi:hypothetical protein